MTNRLSIRLALVPAASLLFACGGSQSMPAAGSQTPAPAASSNMAAPAGPMMPQGVTAEMVAAGDSLFNAPRSCNGCHGKGGTNGRNGPDLTTGTYEHVDGSYASLVKIITDGVPKEAIKHPEHRFAMRPRGGHDYTDAQVATLAAYVWTLGHHK